MEERKWEDMPTDCLVRIFGRLDLESRLFHVPFVCKPWSRALCNPLCWQQLDFPANIYNSRLWNSYVLYIMKSHDWMKLVNFVVNKSQRCATSLVLPKYSSREELIYVSEECPALKMLELPADVCLHDSHIILSLIVKWKNLEFLTLGSSSFDCVLEILGRICIYLPKFNGLCLKSGHVSDELASTIVSKLPKLKYLTIYAKIDKKNLLLILRGCKELVCLDVRNCIGFNKGDEEILKFSSVIKNFRCDGSMLHGGWLLHG